jgi:EmrB/QacA subfamily drug resistance transporter
MTSRLSEQPIRGRPLILAACMAATFMAAIEATIIATVMPVIANSLGDYGQYAWVFSAYMLAQAVTIPLYGRLADMFGRREVFFAGVALFLLGSALCGFAESMAQLVAFRTIQGLGAGGVQPVANTIVGDIFSPVERARIQGLLSSVFGVAAIAGPSVGAAIASSGHWAWVFWINIPAGAAAAAMIALFLPRHAQPRQRQVDYAGSFLLTLSVGALMLLLLHGPALPGGKLALTFAVFCAAGVALIWYERRVPEPMLPLELWRLPIVATSGMGNFATGVLMMGITAYMPAFTQGVLGEGTGATATILATMALVWPLGSTVAGLRLARSSFRAVASMGALALILGTTELALLPPEASWQLAGLGAAAIGVGMGFCNTTFMVCGQTSVAWVQRGAATSSIMFLRFMGQALGAALFGAVVNSGLSGAAAANGPVLDQIMNPARRAALSADEIARLTDVAAAAMRHGFLMSVALAVLTLVLARKYPPGLGPATQKRQA